MKTELAIGLVTILSVVYLAAGQADPATSTPHNCNCRSTCRATARDLYTRDRCHVQHFCGKCLFWGWFCWDYCQYTDVKRTNEVSQTWDQKHNALLNLINADDTMERSYVDRFLFTSMITSFENEWDIMPKGRKKTIHPVGAHCPFKIDITPGSPYTGLLKPGTVEGLIRLGPSLDPWDLLPAALAGIHLIPGAGIKFLRTGVTSGNVVLLNSFAALPNQNYNFFDQPLFNAFTANIDNPVGSVIAQKFCQTNVCLSKVGLSHLTTHDQDGNEAPSPEFPYKLALDPSAISFPEARPASLQAFMDQFKTIPVGSSIYKVKTYSDPHDAVGTVLGDLVTTGPCVTSKFGDGEFFIRHRPIDEDIARKPQWAEAYREGCGLDTCIF